MPDWKHKGKAASAHVPAADRAQWSMKLDAFLADQLQDDPTDAKVSDSEADTGSDDAAVFKKARLLANTIEARTFDHCLYAVSGHTLEPFKAAVSLKPHASNDVSCDTFQARQGATLFAEASISK